jgi:N,N-dimethylformamidase beta subunit-like protein
VHFLVQHQICITDEDVDNSSIFINKSANNASSQSSSINKYDVLILGHQEYVTQKEYRNLKHFVENGGTLILLDGNVFYAQVNYDRHHHTITLVRGHGWAFNGKSAWKSVSERWAKETSQWIGSNFLPCVCPVTFANDPFEYKHHEEQYVTNHNDTILTNYDARLVTKQYIGYKPVIATYELHYKKGRVIVLGLYSDDILDNLKFDKYFDTLLIQHAFKQCQLSKKDKHIIMQFICN